MKIIVTQEHIDNGKRDDAEQCPIALAITAAGLLHTSVGYHFVSGAEFVSGVFYHRYTQLPKVAYEFVRDFDSARPVKPFEFELEFRPCE